MKTEIELFKPAQLSQNLIIPLYIPSPLFKRKISFLLLPMVFLFVKLPPELVLESLLYPGSFKIFFPIDWSLLLVVPQSFLLILSKLSLLKSVLARLQMLFRPLITSTPLSQLQSPQKQLGEFSGKIYSKLW